MFLTGQSFLPIRPASNLSMATVSGLGALSCRRAKVLNASIPNLTAAFTKMKEIAMRVKLPYEMRLKVAPIVVVG